MKALVMAQVLVPLSGEVEVLVLVWDLELALAEVLLEESVLVRESVRDLVEARVSLLELVLVEELV